MADESELGQLMSSKAWKGDPPAARLATPLRVRTVRLTWLSTHGDPIQASLIGFKLDNEGNRLPPPLVEPKIKPDKRKNDGQNGGKNGGSVV